MAKCKNCKKLCLCREKDGSNYYWCYLINDNPDIDKERECQNYEVANNSDMIRKMTDEELANQIFKIDQSEYIKFCLSKPECVEGDIDITNDMCKQCLLEWLQKEVE